MLKRKCKLLVLCIIIPCILTGCSGYEISTKLVSDAIVFTKDKLILVADNGDKSELFDVEYKEFDTSLKEIKKKYDLKPFLSHSKEIIISADVTVKQLSIIIDELKENNEIAPDIKITLAEKEAIGLLEDGKVKAGEIYTLIKNSGVCDERICSYNSHITGEKFTMLYENRDELKIKQITI